MVQRTAALSLDLDAVDLGFAAAALATPGARGRERAALQELSGGALPCLSVRSGFDLWLRAMAFPPGSEVVMSAVTLPDMARVVAEHGLVPVPIDIDALTLAPRAAELEQVIGPRTRAVVVAHLFGGLCDLAPIARVARRAGIWLVEDCAQAFAGDGVWGDPCADVSLWSFGPIKTATALGGGLVQVRDAAVRARMEQIAAGDPVQSRRDFAGRLARFGALWGATRPDAYRRLAALADLFDRDPAALAKGFSRSFRAGNLLAAIRRQPGYPLLALLRHRLAAVGPEHVAARAFAGERTAQRLARFLVPGRAARRRTWWLFPVAVSDPEAACAALRAIGCDAARGTTSLSALRAPKHVPAPARAVALMQSLIYLPLCDGDGLEQVARALAPFAQRESGAPLRRAA